MTKSCRIGPSTILPTKNTPRGSLGCPHEGLSDEQTQLPGPTLTPAERRIAGAKAPTNAAGVKLCWNFNSHVGFPDTSCPRAHEYAKNFDSLAPQIKMVLAKRYGFKKKPKLTEPKINETIRALRTEIAADATARRQAPGARTDAQPSWQPASRVSGPAIFAPKELTDLDYVLDEAELRTAAHPSDSPFGSLHPQEECPDVGYITHEINPDVDDPNLARTREVLEQLDQDKSMVVLNDLPPHLATFIRAHVMRDKFSGSTDTELSITNAIESAAKLGLPSLRGEAACFSATRTRVGKTDNRPTECDDEHVYFNCSESLGNVKITVAVIRGRQWGVVDFGDTIPEIANDPIWDFMEKVCRGKTNAY